MLGLVTLVTIVLVSLLAQWIAPYPYEEIDLFHSFAPFVSPGNPDRPMHLFGTDKLGRDILSRLLYAGRISLGVALTVTLLITIIILITTYRPHPVVAEASEWIAADSPCFFCYSARRRSRA